MNKNKIIFVVGILVLVSVSSLYVQHSDSISTPTQVLQGVYSHTPLNLSIDQGVEVLKLPLTQVVAENNASGNLPYENKPVIIFDHNVTLSLYKGTTVNGTVIAIQVTNVGSHDVEVQDVGLKGAIQQGIEFTTIIDKHIIGCTGDTPFEEKVETVSSNGTTVTQNIPTIVKCGQVASHDPLILKPGKSMTANIVADMKAGNTAINQFSAYTNYLSGPNMYGIIVPFQTIN